MLEVWIDTRRVAAFYQEFVHGKATRDGAVPGVGGGGIGYERSWPRRSETYSSLAGGRRYLSGLVENGANLLR